MTTTTFYELDNAGLIARHDELSRRDVDAFAGIDGADPLACAEHLELIAVGAEIARRYAHRARWHDALSAGATIDDVAVARGVSVEQAANDYRSWLDSQHRLWQDTPEGRTPIGLDATRYRAGLAHLSNVAGF